MLYRSLEGNTLSTNHGLNLKTSSPKTAGSSSGTEVMSFLISVLISEAREVA